MKHERIENNFGLQFPFPVKVLIPIFFCVFACYLSIILCLFTFSFDSGKTNQSRECI